MSERVYRKNGGRPPKLDSDRRSTRLQPGFTLYEIAELESKALLAGIDLITYVRTAALGNSIKTVPQVNRRVYIELARLAGNLNQLARAANTLNTIDNAVLGKALVTLHGLVQQLRGELLGLNQT